MTSGNKLQTRPLPRADNDRPPLPLFARRPPAPLSDRQLDFAAIRGAFSMLPIEPAADDL